MMTEYHQLISRAQNLVKPVQLSRHDLDAATVGCALLAHNGSVYEGICIHLACGLGFCAEAAAIANMLKDGETRINAIVAVSKAGVLSPCGRCREMMLQVDERNGDSDIILPQGRTMKLQALLPMHWFKDKEAGLA